MTAQERLKLFISYKGISMRKFEMAACVPVGYVKNIKYTITPDKQEKISAAFPELNLGWLTSGEGNMLRNSSAPDTTEDSCTNVAIEQSDNTKSKVIPLLPISAQGGSLNDFSVSVISHECEKVVSPIIDVDFAMSISGDSMSPEYPSGCQVLIKKINESAFIEIGRAHV